MTARARFTLLGIGAAASPRYPPAGLLVEHRDSQVMVDGGPGAEPDGPLDAWLVTDERAELMAAIRRLRAGALDLDRVGAAAISPGPSFLSGIAGP